MKGYFYDEGYLRTSSREFSITNLSNKFVHLTNDSKQIYFEPPYTEGPGVYNITL